VYPNAFYRVSVKALIKGTNGTILVVKENQDTWSLPGGGLDHGEDPKKGILRELKEELGIQKAAISGVVCAKTFYLTARSSWLMWIVYKVTIDDLPFALGEGVTAAQYVDSSNLADSPDVFEKMVYHVSIDSAHLL